MKIQETNERNRKMTTKRIAAELMDDNAIKAEIIYTTTRLNTEPKKDADKLFFELAITAIEKAIQGCKEATGVQFPSHQQLMRFMTKETHLTKEEETTTTNATNSNKNQEGTTK